MIPSLLQISHSCLVCCSGLELGLLWLVTPKRLKDLFNCWSGGAVSIHTLKQSSCQDFYVSLNCHWMTWSLACGWHMDKILDIVHGATKGHKCRARRVRAWIPTRNIGGSVWLDWAMLWLHGWCQGLCHVCCDTVFLVLKGNGGSLIIKSLHNNCTRRTMVHV